MNVKINRVANTYNSGCFGVLTINDEPICVTLEETWLDNIPYESCVPPGNYKVVPHKGCKYKNVWRIDNVPERTGVLIHWGNTELDTAGCVLVGKYYASFGAKRGVADSVKTIKMLRDILPDEFMLTIENNF